MLSSVRTAYALLCSWLVVVLSLSSHFPFLFLWAAFQMMDADYYIDYHSGRGASPVIRLYGVTERGNSVMAHVKGFMPYFYVTCWPNFSQVSSASDRIA